MKRCKTGSINHDRMLELPLHLLFDILSMLTVETIFSCKCVCKTFLKILKDPHFVELHLKKAPNMDNGLIIQDRNNISNFLLVYNNEFGKPDCDKTSYDSRPCQTLAIPTTASQYYNRMVYFVGSYNGLLCLRYMNEKYTSHIHYICNPILGEFLALSSPYMQYKAHCDFSGFGFCPKTKQYKVILFVNSSICSIHTLGTDCWRQVGNAPYPRTMASFDSSLNGNLHWITASTNMSNLICSFNLETEQFSYISSPLHLNQDELKYMYSTVGLLDGLFCFNYCITGKYEVFVMHDYGPEGCWTKKISIDLNSFNVKGGIVGYLNNGDLVHKCNLSTLIYCNIRKGTTRHMLAEEKVRCYGVLSFVPSFISLKDLAGASAENVEVVQRKMGRNLWTANGFTFIR